MKLKDLPLNAVFTITGDESKTKYIVYMDASDGKDPIPLYTAPPKRKPIEDGELEVWYSQHTWAMDKQEYMWGFRDAEKCYGIGGGE